MAISGYRVVKLESTERRGWLMIWGSIEGAGLTEMVEVKRVSARSLFNLPLYEHHLVIDTRSEKDYHEGHVATAVSFPGPALDCSELEREKLLVQFIRGYVKDFLRPENPSPIVIYGSNEQPESKHHREWLVKKLEKLHRDRQALAPLDSTTTDQPTQETQENRPSYFEQFCSILADYTREIWILDCSYESFLQDYDFLCGHVEFSSMFPLPHQITDYLFLGSRLVPLTQQCLSQLRVTHMIVSQNQRHLDWSELKGISVLKCDVQDSNSQEMRACWDASCLFIDEALRSHEIGSKDKGVVSSLDVMSKRCRILILLYGRSRSTSVVIAHMIRRYGMSFDEAWDTIRAECWHLIDRSLVYEDQLRLYHEENTRLALDEDLS